MRGAKPLPKSQPSDAEESESRPSVKDLNSLFNVAKPWFFHAPRGVLVTTRRSKPTITSGKCVLDRLYRVYLLHRKSTLCKRCIRKCSPKWISRTEEFRLRLFVNTSIGRVFIPLSDYCVVSNNLKFYFRIITCAATSELCVQSTFAPISYSFGDWSLRIYTI